MPSTGAEEYGLRRNSRTHRAALHAPPVAAHGGVLLGAKRDFLRAAWRDDGLLDQFRRDRLTALRGHSSAPACA
jgi:hypothetical protein